MSADFPSAACPECGAVIAEGRCVACGAFLSLPVRPAPQPTENLTVRVPADAGERLATRPDLVRAAMAMVTR